MRLALTGGGTGGHVYPALEVAREASDRGAEILYLGSLRGQEGAACRARGILFEGFPSEPLYSLRTPRGWRAAVALLRCTTMARSALRAAHPDAVFSTGGYSAAPIMAAARSLGIPYHIHEANSVPGRSNRMFSARAAAITCSFFATQKQFRHAVRTGQPIRHELREAMRRAREQGTDAATCQRVLVLGGSQGSAFLNDLVPRAAAFLPAEVCTLHATGPSHFEAMGNSVKQGPNYELVPFLEVDAMADAYVASSVAIARSGGTLAEFALFGLPSVLVPLPSSADNHQLENAREFEALGGAIILQQSQATPESLASQVMAWLTDGPRREKARTALNNWDVPDATHRIASILFGVVSAG